jgi:hypothetical protein
MWFFLGIGPAGHEQGRSFRVLSAGSDAGGAFASAAQEFSVSLLALAGAFGGSFFILIGFGLAWIRQPIIHQILRKS